jgi:uncharacterized alkaline shock family protein YloU
MPKRLIGYSEQFEPLYREDIVLYRKLVTRKKRHISIYIERAEEAFVEGNINLAVQYKNMAEVATNIAEKLVSEIRRLEEIQARWAN